MRRGTEKILKSKRKLVEKARQAIIGSLKKNVFKFVLIFAFAIAMFILGQAIIGAPHPHLFGGRLTEFASRVLLLSVVFLVFAAMMEIKKIADVICSLFAYEIAGSKGSFDASAFKRAVLILRPLFYAGVGVFAFLLFENIFLWMHPLLNVVIGIAISLWVAIASYISFEMLTDRAGVLHKWPFILADDLVEVVVHLSSPEIISREVDFAYEKVSEETQKVRKIFEWKYGNLVAILLVIAATYFLVNSGIIESIATRLGELQYLGAFVAGFLFTSILTVPFAVVGILALAATGMNPYVLAVVGGFGAMIGDYALYSAFRNSINSTKQLAAKYKIKFPNMKSRTLKMIAPIFAGFVIMSPLPDEIGVAILGAVHFNPKYFLLLAFLCNSIGIFCVAAVATA